MKKLLSLLLVATLCLSLGVAMAEEEAIVAEEEAIVAEEEAVVAEEEAVVEEEAAAEEEAADEEETITVAASFADLELAAPTVVTMTTKRKGDTSTVVLGGDFDTAEVWWPIEDVTEELVVEDGVATYSHAGHKNQEGIYYADGDNCPSTWSWGNDAYCVTVGNTTFYYARNGKCHTISDVIENANFFRSGVASKATITWQRTVDNGWFPETITEEYEDGEISKVTALYKNDKGKSLVHYIVTYDDGDDGVYNVRYGANDKYYGVTAKKDGVSYKNGSAKYRNRWENSSTFKWADDAGLRPISDFATSPRAE